jgi:hypothetical protein
MEGQKAQEKAGFSAKTATAHTRHPSGRQNSLWQRKKRLARKSRFRTTEMWEATLALWCDRGLARRNAESAFSRAIPPSHHPGFGRRLLQITTAGKKTEARPF